MAKKKIRIKKKKAKRKIRIKPKPKRKIKIKGKPKPKRKIKVKGKPKPKRKIKIRKPKPKPKPKPKKKRRKLPITLAWEWIVIGYANLNYSGMPDHRYNIIATGRNRDEAIEAARELIAQDVDTQHAVDAVFTKVVKGKTTSEEPGLAEWRSET